jgi:two-component system, NtrC family, sensor histidine kinase HydH
MSVPILDELKHYVAFGPADEAALRLLHPIAKAHFVRIADFFYRRVEDHEGARQVLAHGETSVGSLKVTLRAWMERLLSGPWDDEYFELRCRIGRKHVRIAMPQHYMFGAMNVMRQELGLVIDAEVLPRDAAQAQAARLAVGKALDLELAIMLHTYREDLLAQQAKSERLSTFGQLVGSIGHELRNPLGVMESSLYILRGRTQDDERARKHVERIGQQVGIANSIISDLLDMIRDKPVQLERFPLGKLLEAAAELVRRPEGVRLSLPATGSLPELSADFSQLRQVFVNLFDNAVHAASPVGEVKVTAELQPGLLVVAVEDTGPGVDPETLRRLFEPLVTTKTKGIGLGLSLVRRIAERHGGTVTYEPQGPGARFVVRLPGGP